MTKKYSLAISLLAALVLAGCTPVAPKKSSNPVSSDPAPVSSDDTPVSSDDTPVSSEEPEPEKKGWEDPKDYTFKDYLTVCPSNWNELTYQDNNDNEIMGYIGGNFFRFNYKFDEDGKIKDGEFVVEKDAISDVEDVTDVYAGNENYAVPAEDDEGNPVESGYAYKFTLRNDLKWDDGTPIKAKDFVYTMKEQENPLFQNYRADSFYNGATVIHNARNYVKQGQSGWFASKECYGGSYKESQDSTLIFHMVLPLEENDPYGNAKPYILTGTSLANYANYVAARGAAWTMAALWGCPSTADEFAAMEGKTLAEIKADATLKGYWEKLIGWWQTDPGEELDFFVTYYTYPELSFDKVGLFVGEKDNELIIVLDKYLPLFKDNGDLSYHAAYEFGSLPLVKESLYEANKVAPKTEGGLWTTTYNTDLSKTASWGPYKLTAFQAGKGYTLSRNVNWYGYNMDEYKGQYQTDVIDVEVIPNYETALLKFREGDLQSIGIDVSVADTYKNSKRAFFTASDFVGSLQLQSNAEKLAERSDASHNKKILKYVDFRKALSLAIDRADYNNKCTTSSLAGFGIFNSMHYYDVENGGVYRNEDVAKRVICEVYGVDVSAYASLDEAYAAVTGYNLNLARELLNSAYDEAKAAGDITDTDTVVLTLGTAEDTISTRRIFNYLKDAFENLAKGTKLEGRLTLEFDAHFGDQWADDFRAGSYDICTGGWTGAAWNPGYFLLAYLSPDYMYSQAWETDKVMLEFNPFGDGNDDHKYTMSLLDWYDCLNGASDAPYNFSDGAVDTDVRLAIIAALEKEILKVYYTVPLSYSFSAGMISYKIEYITRTYNTFMSYGGIRYITYNYDDTAWEAVKGSFDYSK